MVKLFVSRDSFRIEHLRKLAHLLISICSTILMIWYYVLLKPRTLQPILDGRNSKNKIRDFCNLGDSLKCLLKKPSRNRWFIKPSTKLSMRKKKQTESPNRGFLLGNHPQNSRTWGAGTSIFRHKLLVSLGSTLSKLAIIHSYISSVEHPRNILLIKSIAFKTLPFRTGKHQHFQVPCRYLQGARFERDVQGSPHRNTWTLLGIRNVQWPNLTRKTFQNPSI